MDCPPYNLNSRKVKEDSSTREKDFASNISTSTLKKAVSSDHYTCTTKSTQEATLIVITGYSTSPTQSKTIDYSTPGIAPRHSEYLSTLGTGQSGSPFYSSLPESPPGTSEAAVSQYHPPKPTQVETCVSSNSGSDSPLSSTVKGHQAREPLDPMFMRTVTAKEFVCGESRYKCSACLRYFENLGCLQSHIEQGWEEGFSCRVFYGKLKVMRDRSLQKRSQKSPYVSTAESQLSSPADSQSGGRKSNKEKKSDLIQKWLLKTELPETPQ
ncbi:hypothetical protein EOD39_3958 [Acipenser ruthenus]|uniref:C2H2-type domain-containing protein n=1 Tax=Acipenser ruthenus TaxID=7906 RepID=A0A444UKJ6_ACIRT|nr:hypothetical protein EOD39_3958 [Acipenser ruthenus]